MQRAKPDSERLAEVYRQLHEAFSTSNWEALAKADLAIRQLLVQLPADAHLDATAWQIKQRMKSLHAQALEKCGLECKRLEKVLSNHTRHAEGRSAYMQVTSFGGDGS